MSRYDVAEIVLVLAFIGGVSCAIPKPSRALVPKETITRELRTIDGRIVECTLREDHTNQWRSFSC